MQELDLKTIKQSLCKKLLMCLGISFGSVYSILQKYKGRLIS